jgi:hypothetical protein
LLYSCKPADYYYGEYLANGELYYPGRIDSLSIIPGNQRAKLRLRITTDPKVNTLKVALRNSLSPDQQLLTFPIAEGEHGQIRLIELDDLVEATYTVNVYTATANGDSSRTVAASQFIYGESYIKTLVNRTVSGINKTDPGLHYLIFASESNLPRQGTFYPMQYTEVKYRNTSGDSTTVTITPYETLASLEDIASPSTITYRTVYKPVVASLDYFYTDKKEFDYVK